MGYETYFLKAQITVILNEPVKVVRVKSLSPGQLRLGLVNVSETDRAILEAHTLSMMEAFPTLGNQNLRLKGLFPTQTDIDESGGKDMVFFSADKKTTTLFDCSRRKVSISANLPSVSTCRVAILLSGMKTKGNEVSFMARILQLKLVKTKEDRLETNSECLFDYSTDTGDDTEAIDEEGEEAH
jgi:hypothetical protein